MREQCPRCEAINHMFDHAEKNNHDMKTIRDSLRKSLCICEKTQMQDDDEFVFCVDWSKIDERHAARYNKR